MSLEGIREAFYWRQNSLSIKNIKYNIHGLFLIQRIIVFSLIISIMILKSFLLLSIILICVGLTLISPFFHNGFYYLGRHLLDKDIYLKGFFDQSNSSTAKSTKFLTPVMRSIYLSIGVILLIISIL